MIGGGGEKKTLRLVAQYADACNFFGTPEVVGAQARCAARALRGGWAAISAKSKSPHCLVPTRAGPPDDVVRAAEAYGAVGVSTVMGSALGDDPAGKLETLFGPAVDRLKSIQPKTL